MRDDDAAQTSFSPKFMWNNRRRRMKYLRADCYWCAVVVIVVLVAAAIPSRRLLTLFFPFSSLIRYEYFSFYRNCVDERISQTHRHAREFQIARHTDISTKSRIQSSEAEK